MHSKRKGEILLCSILFSRCQSKSSSVTLFSETLSEINSIPKNKILQFYVAQLRKNRRQAARDTKTIKTEVLQTPSAPLHQDRIISKLKSIEICAPSHTILILALDEILYTFASAYCCMLKFDM